MRDIGLTLIILTALPYIFSRPYVGVLVWTWLAYFNPQKMMYGFALRLPFSQIVGGATLLSWLFNKKEPKKMPSSTASTIWIIFIMWMGMTTFFAIQPEPAWTQLIKVFKIQLFALVTVIMTNSWERVRQLVWCIVLSIGWFSVKGGIWVIKTGGANGGLVWGPTGTFIEGNNELALATLMTIPLAYFLYSTETRKWVKRALLFGMVMSALSVAGSFSRGAMLAGVATALFLTWRSKSRFSVGAIVLLVGIGVVSFMPDSWTARFHTIEKYEDDGSAQKRINSWYFAWNFVQDNPVTGGGFEMFTSVEAYRKYAPYFNEAWVFDAHSNYMKILGEHGFPGLILFLLLFFFAWREATKVMKWGEKFQPGTAENNFGMLARMLQSSIVAYSVGGAFLGLCYFDLPYNIVGLCICLGSKAVQLSVANVAPSPTTGGPTIPKKLKEPSRAT